jgi:hypothetical protein
MHINILLLTYKLLKEKPYWLTFYIGSWIFRKLVFLGDFLYISLGGNYRKSETVTWDEKRSSEAAGGGGWAHSALNEPKKMGARSANKTFETH